MIVDGLIQDIKPFDKQSFDTKPETLDNVSSEAMVTELFSRRVEMERIFGIYYALGEMSNPILTVGDAQLVFGEPQPLNEQPF